MYLAKASMKNVLRILLLVAALPAFWVAGFLVANPLIAPDFEPVDLADAPVDLAVLAAWEAESGELECRAFYRRHLVQHSSSLPPLRFTVSNEELASCVVAFRQYGVAGRWDNEFDFDRRGFVAGVQRPEAADPGLFIVTYRPDVDRIADSRYRIDPLSGQPTDFEFRGAFGPAQGIGVLMFGGAGGTVAWLLLVVYVATRWVRRRRERQAIPALDRP